MISYIFKPQFLSLFVSISIILSSISSFSTEREEIELEDCLVANEQLNAKIELNEQQGLAFLKTMESLEQVYSNFGKRLSAATKPEEIAEISRHFLRSAKALQEASTQNDQVVKNLALKTKELAERVSNCFQQSAILGGLLPWETRKVYFSDSYVPQNLSSSQEAIVVLSGQVHVCALWNEPKISKMDDFNHEISATVSLYNCSYPILYNQRPFQKEFDLGKLKPGFHKLKYTVDAIGNYREISFEVRP